MNPNEMSQDVASELWQEALELRGSRKKAKIKKAIRLVQRIMAERDDVPPISTKLRSFIGDCYHINLGQHDKAIEYYEKAIETDVNDPWPSIMLGEIYLQEKKDYETTIRILERTINRGISVSGQRDIAKDLLIEAKQKLVSG